MLCVAPRVLALNFQLYSSYKLGMVSFGRFIARDPFFSPISFALSNFSNSPSFFRIFCILTECLWAADHIYTLKFCVYFAFHGKKIFGRKKTERKLEEQ